MKKIILASNSPRRRELLAGLDLPYEVRVLPGVDESYPADMPATEVPLHIARKKAAAYHAMPDEVVLTADTVVVLDGQVLGKPRSLDEARHMLTRLSGRTHTVVTGVCLSTNRESRSFAVETEVTFNTLSNEQIYYYVNKYHPLDKAGAYGVQEWIGYVGVASIHGSYYNVMGLPVQRVYQELTSMGALSNA